MSNLNRRQWLATSATAGVGLFAAHSRADDSKKSDPVKYCLNTSTLRGQKLSIVEEIELASSVGYTGIEPWIRELDQYVESGGSLRDLRKRLEDKGLTVESAIGFAQWIADDDAAREKGLEEAKRTMDMIRQLGGTRIAAPPTGGTRGTVDLQRSGERYRALLELGDKMEVVPLLEVWGFSKSLSRLSESVYTAIASGHPKASLLLDVYHLYKGGSKFESIHLLDGKAMPVFHMNDYPANPPREMIGDADRVYPGDGVAPITTLLRDLYAVGFQGVLSLELFNREYWKQDPKVVAKTGLEKMQAAVRKSLA